jgi:membrane-associated phospholipid phosphatase
MGAWFLWEWINKPNFPIVIFIMSLIVALSRIYYKCHTLLQVIVGYGFGMLSMYISNKYILSMFNYADIY